MSERGFCDLLRWKLKGRPARWPEKVPIVPVSVPPAPRGDGVVITWIGHATFLLQVSGSTWITDPVFSKRIGPIRGLGPRRVAAPAIALANLPRIDGILLSHDHYDHCDLPSLRALVEKNEALVVVAPLNYGSLLKPVRGACDLVELDWWQSWEGPGDVSIELVPRATGAAGASAGQMSDCGAGFSSGAADGRFISPATRVTMARFSRKSPAAAGHPMLPCCRLEPTNRAGLCASRT